MSECPNCDEKVLEVRGPHESAKDGYSTFKVYVHETDSLGPFTEITESCMEHLK